MKIYSWNVNGIRAVFNKGALETFIKKEKPDIILFQEIKAKKDKLPEELQDFDYTQFYNPAEKPGYAGTAIWVNNKHEKEIEGFSKGMPKWDDYEGRVTTCDFKNGLSVTSIYAPNGGKSEEHYKEKLKFYTTLASFANKMKDSKKKVIIGGDFNVARSDLDLSEPDKFRDHHHFNPEVKGKIEDMIKNANLVDTFRSRNPKKEGAYTYWDNFDFSLKGVKPREVNKGWRIDYFFAEKNLDKKIKKVSIKDKIMGSDHCPILVEV